MAAKYPRLLVAAVAAHLVLVLFVAALAWSRVDPSVALRHASLLGGALVELPVGPGDALVQGVTIDSGALTHVDVLVRSPEATTITLRALDADDQVVRRARVKVDASKEARYVRIQIPDEALSAGRYELEFGVDAAAPVAYVLGTNCDCFAGGTARSEAVSYALDELAQPTDLIVSTFTLAGSKERAKFVAERLGAYHPSWLTARPLMAFALVCWLAYGVVVAAALGHVFRTILDIRVRLLVTAATLLVPLIAVLL